MLFSKNCAGAERGMQNNLGTLYVISSCQIKHFDRGRMRVGRDLPRYSTPGSECTFQYSQASSPATAADHPSRLSSPRSAGHDPRRQPSNATPPTPSRPFCCTSSLDPCKATADIRSSFSNLHKINYLLYEIYGNESCHLLDNNGLLHQKHTAFLGDITCKSCCAAFSAGGTHVIQANTTRTSLYMRAPNKHSICKTHASISRSCRLF